MTEIGRDTDAMTTDGSDGNFNTGSVYDANILSRWPGEALLASNLAAMASRDAAGAERVKGVQLADRERLTVSRDGRPTYRVLQADGRWEWLGKCSTPLTAARVQAQKIACGRGNMAMLGVGSGAAIQLLLEKMALHQALIVLEQDARAVNLAFRLWDYAAALRAGRLVILVGTNSDELLANFYRSNPGYNIAEQTVNQLWMTEQQNRGFAQQMSIIMDLIAKESLRAIDKLAKQMQENDAAAAKNAEQADHKLPGQFRIANCTNVFEMKDYCTSRDLLAGFSQLGIAVDHLAFDRPDIVSAQAQFERFLRFQPEVILLVDCVRGDFSYRLPTSAVCVTVLREPGESFYKAERRVAEKMGERDVIIPCRAEQADKLIEAGLDRKRILTVGLGANIDLYKPITVDDSANVIFGGDVALIADRFSTDPEKYGIKLPFHLQLLQAAAAEIRRDPGGYYRDAAGKFFDRAQRATVRLQEEDLKKHFLSLIENCIGPAAMLDGYTETIIKEKIDLRIWGWSDLKRGVTATRPDHWPESPAAAKVAGTIPPDENLNRLYNSTKIFLHISDTGFVDRYLLDGIAAGAFILVKSHPGHQNADGLGTMFKPGKELITFDSPRDMINKIRYYLSKPEERKRIAAAARERLINDHTTRRRAEQIRDFLLR